MCEVLNVSKPFQADLGGTGQQATVSILYNLNIFLAFCSIFNTKSYKLFAIILTDVREGDLNL